MIEEFPHRLSVEIQAIAPHNPQHATRNLFAQ